jgi:hypothetical protein
MAFAERMGEMLPPDDSVRDPKVTPRPGDRFRCRSGTELEVTGVVSSVTKKRIETRFLQVNRYYPNHMTRRISSEATVKNEIKKAEILARGSD